MKGIGPKTYASFLASFSYHPDFRFENCAGFLRIHDGSNRLDATGVHPESYHLAKLLVSRILESDDAYETGEWTSSLLQKEARLEYSFPPFFSLLAFVC